MSRDLKLELCIAEPSEPFICGVTGQATLDTFQDIQSQLPEWMESQRFDPSCVTVHVVARHVEAEYHDDRVAIPSYWDLTVIEPAANLDLLIADVEARGWAWTLRKTRDVGLELEEEHGQYIARIWTVASLTALNVDYLGIDYGATPAAALAAALAQVQVRAEAGV